LPLEVCDGLLKRAGKFFLALALASLRGCVERGVLVCDGASLLFERAPQTFGLLGLALYASKVSVGGERLIVNARARGLYDFFGETEAPRYLKSGGGACDADEQSVGWL